MTAVAEAEAAPPDTIPPAPEPEPEPVPEAPVEPAPARRTRAQVVQEVKDTLEKMCERVILARQMCTGDPKVMNGQLCNEGTQDFMAKGHLHPPGYQYHVDYGRERIEHREAGEKLIRKDVWKPFGEPGCDLDDYTLQGLDKRLRQAVVAHEKWAKDFRQLIVSNTGTYITPQRRNEAFASLGLEPWTPQRRIEFTLRHSLTEPTVEDRSRNWQAEQFRGRLIRALRAEFGDALGDEATIMMFLSVTARDL